MTTDPVPALFGCEDIHIRLGGRPILEGVTVSIRPGEILGVVGPNGAGKTTLFEVLSGRYAPDRGRVMLGGRDITSLKLFARARLGLGRTYQSPVVPDALDRGRGVSRRAAGPSAVPHAVSCRMGRGPGRFARADVGVGRFAGDAEPA